MNHWCHLPSLPPPSPQPSPSSSPSSPIYLSIGFHSPSGIRRPVSHLDVGIRLPLQLLFVLVTLHILRCLLIFVLDLKSLQSSHRTRSPFFSFSLFSCCVFLSSSVSVYILSFPIAHILLWRAILATDFLSPQYGHIPFGALMQYFWWLVNDTLSFRVVLQRPKPIGSALGGCLISWWIIPGCLLCQFATGATLSSQLRGPF